MEKNVVKAVVDRIVDGQKAVLLVGEDEVEYILAAGQLPAGAKEGDWLKVAIHYGEITMLEPDGEETEAIRRRIEAKMAQLKQKNDGSKFRT